MAAGFMCERLAALTGLCALLPAAALQIDWPPPVPDAIELARVSADEGAEIVSMTEYNGVSWEGRGLTENCFMDPARSKWNITTKRMAKLKDSMFVQQPPKPIIEKEVPTKVAFLMFVKDKVLNPKLWLQWLKDAHNTGIDFNLIIHAYDIHRPFGRYDKNEFRQKEFLKYVSPEWSWSNWCMMWDAEFLLFKQALQDKNVTHIMVLSQDTIPVKPMRYIYQALEDDPATRMCADDYVYKPWPRAETWWVMRRGDAEIFQEHEGQAHKFAAECSEEEAWYYPLRARMERWGQEAAPLRNECVMFTDWADGPSSCKLWAGMVKQCPNNCRVTRSMNHTESATKHPVIFHNMSTPAFMELMASPFWFARKVDNGAMKTPRRFAALLEEYNNTYANPGFGYVENLSIAEAEHDLPEPVEETDNQPKRHWWHRLRPRHH